ncbi:hypothetical protein [Aequorivita soesokkakensis]|uniref:hypothetical protein n=1 Tax=Aequorivita soesokkakensis TaxID=1385699 RepID=UPI000AE28F8C|nr:hypothetical protein [Aequorivita soesokkakensis]
MTLLQRRLFIRRAFTLKKGELNIKSSDLTSSEEVNISYEEIDTSKLIFKKGTDNIMILITVIFGGFFVIYMLNPDNYKEAGWFGTALFIFILAFFSGLITYVKSKNVALIPTVNHGYIEMFNGKPNQIEFDAFLSELTSSINSYLKLKYGTIDLDMPLEPQLMGLSWLKDREIITPAEFENLKKELINNGREHSAIGFHN